MMKFTRPITREIELAGERLAATMGEQGVSIRPVGSRKPPKEISWGAILCHATGQAIGAGTEPSAEELAAAVGALRGGAAAPAKAVTQEAEQPASPEETPPTEGTPMSQPSDV